MLPKKITTFSTKLLDLKTLKSLHGTPLLLSAESVQAYDALLLLFLDVFKPKDVFAQVMIKNLVDVEWESSRFKRHKALAVERRDRDWREQQAKQSGKAEGKKIAKEQEEKPETDHQQHVDSEPGVEDPSFQGSTLAGGLSTPSRELDLARAMEEAIDFYERLDRLDKGGWAKRVTILEQIRLHDESLHIRVMHYCKYVEAVEGERMMLEFMEMSANEERAKEEKAKQDKEIKQRCIEPPAKPDEVK